MQKLTYYLGGFLFAESGTQDNDKKHLAESPFKESRSDVEQYEFTNLDTIQDQEDFKQNKQNLFSLTPRKIEFDAESPKFGKSNKKKQKKKEQLPFAKFQELNQNHPKTELQAYSVSDVHKSVKAKKTWVIHDCKVYDVNIFMNYHPGGYEVLDSMIGKDITHLFNDVHEWVNISQILRNFQIGYIQ